MKLITVFWVFLLNLAVAQESTIVIAPFSFEGNPSMTENQIKSVRENLRDFLKDKTGFEVLLSEDLKQNNNPETYYLYLEISQKKEEPQNRQESIYWIDVTLKRNEEKANTSFFYKDLDVFIKHLKDKEMFLSILFTEFIENSLKVLK